MSALKEEWFRYQLRQLQRECYVTAQNSGFHSSDVHMSKGLGFDDEVTRRLMLISSEVMEAFEHLRKGHMPSKSWNDELADKPDGIPIEMADVVIRVFDFCEVYGIDLVEALRVKMEFNKSREAMHGKRF